MQTFIQLYAKSCYCGRGQTMPYQRQSALTCEHECIKEGEQLTVSVIRYDKNPYLIDTCTYPIYHVRLIDMLGLYKVDNVVLGDVYDNGVIDPDYRTLNCKEHIMLRGGARSRLNLCNTCKKALYFAWPSKMYVMDSSIASGASEYISPGTNTLLLNANIYSSRINISGRTNVGVRKVNVSNNATDGLPPWLSESKCPFINDPRIVELLGEQRKRLVQ